MEQMIELVACCLLPLVGVILLSLFRHFSDDGVSVKMSEDVSQGKGWGTYAPPGSEPPKKPTRRAVRRLP